MRGPIIALITGTLACLVASCLAAAGEPKVVRTYNVADVVITLLTESGELRPGTNRFVLEFDSTRMKRLIDVGLPTVTATPAIPSESPGPARADLVPGDVRGRYVGTLTLRRAGEWELTVAWTRSPSRIPATFPVSVR